MYSRNVNGEELQFGVSGKLWHGVLVMFDRQSDSLWTQLDGRAIEGEQEGTRLEHHDSTFTTWSQWLAEHPNTLVLDKADEEKDQLASHYEDYFDDPERLFMEELHEGLGGIRPKDTVFGISQGGEFLAIQAGLLEEQAVFNTTLDSVPVAFLRNQTTGGVLAVKRQGSSGPLTLTTVEGTDPTLSVRDIHSNQQLAVSDLEQLRVDRAFWYAWSRSHPRSLVLSR